MAQPLKPRKNLTRFTYEDTAFQGWRLCISRGGKTFVKYFSDKKLGGGEAALAAAEKMLAEITSLFEESKKSNGGITKECLSEVSHLIGK